MRVHESGSGPAVLLLHGCPMPPEHLFPLAAALAATHRVLVPELPGYGDTPPAKGDVLAAGSAAVEDALHARGVSEVVAVGLSLGAWRAISLATRGALRVRGLVSLGGFARLDDADRDAKRHLAAALRSGADLREAVPGILLAPATVAARPDAVADVKAWLAATSAANLAAEQEAVAVCEDLIPALRRLRLPLVARAGALDLAIPPRYSEELAAASGGSLEVVPGIAHALLHEDFAGTTGSIRAFLARAGAR